eukprot:NP_491255.2 Uncharacterized protein CELE_C50F2.1 [Caenorhabditis elegans]
MRVKSLFEITSDKVTEYIYNGSYDSINYSLDQKSNLKNIGCFYRDIKDKQYINLISLMNDTFNEATWQNLESLDITGSELFLNGWIRQIGSTLPSLKRLVIAGRTLTDQDFSNLCNNFPNLLSLDISSTNITNLFGIGNLKTLQVLSSRNLEFESYMDLIGLFDLVNLRNLDISRELNFTEPRIVEQYVECGSNLYNFVTSDIRLLNEATLNSSVNLQAYYLSLNNSADINCALNSIRDHLETQQVNETEDADISECLKQLLRLVKTSYVKATEYIIVKCLIELSNFFSLKLITSLIYSKLCWTAMESLTKQHTFLGFYSQALSFLSNLIYGLASTEIEKMANNRRNITRLLEILRCGNDLKNMDYCISATKVLYKMVWTSANARLSMIELGGFKILFDAINSFNDEFVHLNILDTIRAVISYVSLKTCQFLCTDDTFSVFMRILEEYNGARAYQAYIILALLLFSSEIMGSIDRWSSTQRTMLEHIPNGPIDHITDLFDFYVFHRVIQRISMFSKCDGTLLWVLSTIKLVVEENKTYVKKIKESELYVDICNRNVLSEAVMDMNEKVLNLLNSH